MTPDEVQQQIPEQYRTSLIWLPEKKKWHVAIDDDKTLNGPYVQYLAYIEDKDSSAALEKVLQMFKEESNAE